MKWTATACMILTIGCLYVTAPSARSDLEAVRAGNPATVSSARADAPIAAARADTLFLFAASGPGAWGQPGTTPRGYDFDGGSGRDDASCERAGWFGVDKTAQGASTRWHLESTHICSGSDTDMSAAGQPWTPGDAYNDYALWCGALEVCGWINSQGYGNSWRGYCQARVDEDDFDEALTVNFAYSADFEGDVWDYFELFIKVDDDWELIYENHLSGEGGYADKSFTVHKSDYPGATEFGPLRWKFQSDGAWSDEDGLYDSDVGAVWIDNIELLDGEVVGGELILRSDFEDGIVPFWIEFVNPQGAGDFAMLYTNLYSEDICELNSTCAWAFFDPETNDPNYPVPLIPYGPPYIWNVVQSPVLELAHELNEPDGEPFVLDAATRFFCSNWVYFDMPVSSLLYYVIEVAARVQGSDCLNPFVNDNMIIWQDLFGWEQLVEDHDANLRDSAAGGIITGAAVQAGVRDMCEYWCDEPGYGDGTGHKWAPFLDNFEIFVTRDSAVDWHYDIARRFQDNFTGGAGLVRIDPAINVEPSASPTVVRGDSAALKLAMDALGGIASSFNGAAGEYRPNLWLHWQVIAGPHAGLNYPEQGDPGYGDDTGGCYSPWDGIYTGHPDGEPWSRMVADSARFMGEVVADRWAFDFNDAYFLPGDEIVYYFRAEAADHSFHVHPRWAESADPLLRRGIHRVQCLPSAGISLLFVEDAGEMHQWWREAFVYNGYQAYDRFTVQAPGSRLENGLAGMADLDHLAQYHVIIWDSGGLEPYSVTNQTQGDKTWDTVLLQDWLATSEHGAYLWMMGDRIANNLGNGESFLHTTLGLALVAQDFYADHTIGNHPGVGVLVPTVRAVHPDLAYLGQPEVWAYGGCPVPRDFALVDLAGEFTEITHAWDPEPDIPAVAGALNRDPDGNGLPTNDAGYATRAQFNPFSYSRVRDKGWALAAGVDYSKKMVGHVLWRFFDWIEDSPPDDAGVPLYTTGLAGNYPNPFNPKTRIGFSLAVAGHVKLAVYDIAGRAVATLVDERLAAGGHEVEWDGRNQRGQRVASGIYFARMSAGDFAASRRLVMLK